MIFSRSEEILTAWAKYHKLGRTVDLMTMARPNRERCLFFVCRLFLLFFNESFVSKVGVIYKEGSINFERVFEFQIVWPVRWLLYKPGFIPCDFGT
jgi:hypothetical protein